MKSRSTDICFVIAIIGMTLLVNSNAELSPSYKGTPFQDSVYTAVPQQIPGRVECAYYDLGGEGVAYHDTDATNHGSGELNLKPEHHRPHANSYIWGFRANEGVDISYTKDFADFNHTNFVAPATNQFYIGWTADGEWCNYTVNVKQAGTYRIAALYGNAANTISFSINNKPASECKLPLATGSMHKWNKAEIGTITFPEAGLLLLTFHYGKGNNFAYFEFEPTERQ
jgi:carbohydrate binding protein with CBM35 domain